jgi:hypothetical protein
MFKLALNYSKKKMPMLSTISALIALLGLLVDQDKTEIATTTLLFEYVMMTLIILIILFIFSYLIALTRYFFSKAHIN